MQPGAYAASRRLRINREERNTASAFKALVASPVTGLVTLPAGGRLRFRSPAGCAAGTTAATIVSGSTTLVKTPLLAAGESTFTVWAYKGAQVTPAVGFDLMVDVGMGVYSKVAQG